jgi:YihY family inner membrane protein
MKPILFTPRLALPDWFMFNLRRLGRATARIYKRQSEDRVVYLAGSLAYYTIFALVPISAIMLSLFASFIEGEQETIYRYVVSYVFPFSPDDRIPEMDRLAPGFLRSTSAEITQSTSIIEGLPVPSLPQSMESMPDQANRMQTEPLGGSSIWTAPGVVGSASSVLQPQTSSVKVGEAQNDVENALMEGINRYILQAQSLGLVGLVFLIITGVWLFDSIEDAFNSIWRAEKRRPFIRRFTIFWTILTLAPLLMGGPPLLDRYVRSLSVPADWYWANDIYEQAGLFLPYVFTCCAIFLLYQYVPNGVVAKKPAAICAFVVAILWEGAKRLFAEYIAHAHTYSSIYGSLSVVVFVLSWVYLTWWLILMGLEASAYFQYPDWDQKMPSRDISPEMIMLYSWAGLHEIGSRFRTGSGGTQTQDISKALALEQVQVLRILGDLEAKNILTRDRNGLWYPALPLEKINWRQVATSLELDPMQTHIELSNWLDSALRARGLVGYRQNLFEIPSLAQILAEEGSAAELGVASNAPTAGLTLPAPVEGEILECQTGADENSTPAQDPLV